MCIFESATVKLETYEAVQCELGLLHQTEGFEGSPHKQRSMLKHSPVARPMLSDTAKNHYDFISFHSYGYQIIQRL